MKGFQDTTDQITTKVIWSISRAISFISLCVVVFLFSCCQDKTEESNLLLNENEICSNEKLVSITKNGGKYYIGTESSGRIYVYLPEKNSIIDTLNIDCGRIYQVKQTNEANTFYVGTQNMGLKKTRKAGKSLKIDTSYVIRGKGNRFSCYDVFIDEDAVYAMTSHGIFKVGKSDTLDVVYAHYENGHPDPFVANNMVKKGNSLFAATAKGLVKITQNDSTVIIEKSINNVECHNEHIYALSDVLYKLNDKGEVIDSFGLQASADYYYHTDSINYFLSDNYIVLAHDATLQKHQPELYKKVFSRRKLSVEGHNIIADSKDYSLLIADNALWQVGHHLPSVFGELKGGGSKLVCTDGKSIYFLVGKKIYKLDNNFVAKEVLELREKGDINLIECSLDGDSLYYVNSDNEVLRQSFQTPWYKFWPDKPDSIGKSKKEITAMCIDESVPGVILGIRDGLISMNKPNLVNTITLHTLDQDGIDSIPYIRRFFVGDSIYVPTMNEGLFRGKGNTLHVVKGTEKLQFIRDVAIRDSFLYLLTNKHLFLGNDSIDNINHGSRLLVSGDKIYIPGEVGGVRIIQVGKNNEILSDSIRFLDVSFRAESSCMLNDIVYLGGQSGVIALNPNNGETRYVKFVDKAPFPVLRLFLIIIIIAASFILSLILIAKRAYSEREKAYEEKEHAVRKSIERQKERLKKMESLLENNEDAAQKFRQNLDDIRDVIDTIKHEPKDNIHVTVDNISDNISELSKQIYSSLLDRGIKEKEDVAIGNIIDLLDDRIDDLKSHLQGNSEIFDNLRCYIDAISDRIAKLNNNTHENLQEEIDNISHEIDSLSEQVTILSRLKAEYEKSAIRNNSKIKEIEANLLEAVIDEYEKLEGIEHDFARYKLVFEKKIKDEEKDKDLKVDYSVYEDIAFECNQKTKKKSETQIIKDIRKVLGKKSLTSKEKIAILNKEIGKYFEELLKICKEHINNKIAFCDNLFQEDIDSIGLFIDNYKQLKDEVKAIVDGDTQKLFKLIETIIINDGRLEMAIQMKKIRDIVHRKDIDIDSLKNAIICFYSPVIAFHVDMDVYNGLMDITKKDSGEPPRRIRGRNDLVQQPFVILAVAMALQEVPEDCTIFFKESDTGSIKRARNFVAKWINESKTSKFNSDSLSINYLSKLIRQ